MVEQAHELFVHADDAVGSGIGPFLVEQGAAVVGGSVPVGPHGIKASGVQNGVAVREAGFVEVVEQACGRDKQLFDLDTECLGIRKTLGGQLYSGFLAQKQGTLAVAVGAGYEGRALKGKEGGVGW